MIFERILFVLMVFFAFSGLRSLADFETKLVGNFSEYGQNIFASANQPEGRAWTHTPVESTSAQLYFSHNAYEAKKQKNDCRRPRWDLFVLW